MNLTYILYLLTFLAFPILGRVISKHLEIEKSKKAIKWVIIVFTIHNVLFFLGFSIKGDYPDYFVFSLEYLFLCTTTALLYKSTSLYSKVLRVIGTIILTIGFLQGAIGILMFAVVSQDYEADRVYNIDSNGKNYQTRRYSFGFPTLDDTRYTFETYREYHYLPFEKAIHKINFLDLKSDLNFRDNSFIVNIDESESKITLKFSSNGAKFSAAIE